MWCSFWEYGLNLVDDKLWNRAEVMLISGLKVTKMDERDEA